MIYCNCEVGKCDGRAVENCVFRWRERRNHEDKVSTKTKKSIEQVQKCLGALGAAYRDYWGDVDGRDLQDQLLYISSNVSSGSAEYNEFCEYAGIDINTRTWID